MVLTDGPARHAERALAAAQASMQAAAFGKVLKRPATAEAGRSTVGQRCPADLLRGPIAFASGLGGDPPALLLKAARAVEPLDLGLARETYLYAWGAAGGGNMLAVMG